MNDGTGNKTNIFDPDLSKCGVNYCPAGVAEPSASEIAEEIVEAPEVDNFSASKKQLYIIAGVYLACSLASAVTVALFVTPLTQ